MQALARHEATVLTGEEDKTRCNLTRLSRTTHWGGAELLHCGSCHSCWYQRGPYYIHSQCWYNRLGVGGLTWSGANAVYPYSIFELLIRQGPGKPNYRTLR